MIGFWQRLIGFRPRLQHAMRRSIDSLTTQARLPAFYTNDIAPDNFEGRFDITVFHLIFLLRILRSYGVDGKDLSQAIFDQQMRLFDYALREIGIGDTSVGRHVRKLAAKFYDRAQYVEQEITQNKTVTAAAIQYCIPNISEDMIPVLIEYVTALEQDSMHMDPSEILTGHIPWQPPKFDRVETKMQF